MSMGIVRISIFIALITIFSEHLAYKHAETHPPTKEKPLIGRRTIVIKRLKRCGFPRYCVKNPHKPQRIPVVFSLSQKNPHPF